MTGLLIAWLPRGSGVRYAGWWFVSLYTHSALSKFDASFCGQLIELGRQDVAAERE